MKTTNKTKLYTIRVSPETLAEWKSKARGQGLALSKLIEKLLSEHKKSIDKLN